MTAVRRVVFNTGALYLRMGVGTAVGIFSTRLVLNALGASDYGIYNLVAGVVGILGFLNGAMMVATQRYMSFHMGAGDDETLRDIFKISQVLHLATGAVIVLALELTALFVFKSGLNIPPLRIAAAKFVFQCMVASTFFTVVSVPFDATINAHEHMFVDAGFGVAEALAKLGLAIYLRHALGDPLTVFGAGTAAITIAVLLVKRAYCRRYPEVRGPFAIGKARPMLTSMLSFSTWTTVGSLLFVVRYQGIVVLLNLFFGTIANASYGIANQINGQLQSFSSSLIRAMNPQIMKGAGSGDTDRAMGIALLACKYSYLIFAALSIPAMVEMQTILRLWLVHVPENAAFFCRVTLLLTMLRQLTVGTHALVQAKGDIRDFELAVNSLLAAATPIGYVVLKAHGSIELFFFITILVNCLVGLTEVLLARGKTGLSLSAYARVVLMGVGPASAAAFVGAYLAQRCLDAPLVRLGCVFFASTVALCAGTALGGLSPEERRGVRALLSAIRRRGAAQTS